MTDICRVREQELIIDTYPLGAPDPLPPYQLKGNASVYPYPLLDTLSEHKEPRRYRALILENRYLEVTVLPELGGRIYRVADKVSQRDMFYTTHVIKPALIALRGAWIAGGLEWNFRKGHHVDTMAPVAARAVQHDDGSASILVGHPEWVSHMRWQVEITLHPDSAAVHFRVHLANPTPLAHRYYFWANSAEKAAQELEIICPARSAWTSRGRQLDWPIHEGRDLRWYRNILESTDCFFYAPHRDFFGCYDHDSEYGLVHVADARRVPGKKFFTWGVDEHGLMWAEILSDGDGPYIELQTSPQMDQHVWDMFPPQSQHIWEEQWYPVRGIGGFRWANERAAVNLKAQDGHVFIGVAAPRPIDSCRVRLLGRGQTLWEQDASLAPEHPLRAQVEVTWPEEINDALAVQVLTPDGEEIIAYDPQIHTADVPLPPTPPPPERREAEEWVIAAQKAETEAEYDEMERCLREALNRDPGHAGAHVAFARLSARRGLWAAAREHAEAARRRDGRHPEAAYLLGLALAEQGETEEAIWTLWTLHRDPAWAVPAAVALGDLYLRREAWDEALRAYELAASAPIAARRSLALRRMGEQAAALNEARRGAAMLSDGPAWAEIWFNTGDEDDLAALRTALADQAETWLATAVFYQELNALDEAELLLRHAVSDGWPAARHAIAWYHLAHILTLQGERQAAQEALERASRLPHPEIFPHHMSTLRALESALQLRPGDPLPHLYRGELLYALGRVEEAVADWEVASRAGPLAWLARRNLALALRESGRLAEAKAHLEAAIEARPDVLRLYLERDQVAAELGLEPHARLHLLRLAPGHVQRDHRVAIQMARLFTQCEAFDEAIAILESTLFHPWEGERRHREVYVDAYLGRARQAFDRGDYEAALADCRRALTYPKNIRVGRPHRTADAAIYELAGRAAAALGQIDEARAYWQAALAEDHPPDSPLFQAQERARQALARGRAEGER
ncbi:MAG: DUF5107 domain-containing protein [Anaerolineae bacterium]